MFVLLVLKELRFELKDSVKLEGLDHKQRHWIDLALLAPCDWCSRIDRTKRLFNFLQLGLFGDKINLVQQDFVCKHNLE